MTMQAVKADDLFESVYYLPWTRIQVSSCKGAQGLDSRWEEKGHIDRWIAFSVTPCRCQDATMEKTAQKHGPPPPVILKLEQGSIIVYEAFFLVPSVFIKCHQIFRNSITQFIENECQMSHTAYQHLIESMPRRHHAVVKPKDVPILFWECIDDKLATYGISFWKNE